MSKDHITFTCKKLLTLSFLFPNKTYFFYKDHIVVHKPKIFASNLALNGESSVTEVEKIGTSVDAGQTVGHQVRKSK